MLVTASAALLLSLEAVLLLGCAPDKRLPLWTDDAYVWQRQWNENLREALRNSAPAIRDYRILTAEVDATSHLTRVAVDRQMLGQLSQPLIAVIRIDGHNKIGTLPTELVDAIAAITDGWSRGIEIDYDCPTSQLWNYRNFLQQLRARTPPSLTLSITALPSWIGSVETSKLLAEVDESVLQVHSVMNPKHGLFDQDLAYRWTRNWSNISAHPFRVALPTYWSRVTWTSDGRVTAIESEVNRYGDDAEGRELVIAPSDVSHLIGRLKSARLPNLAGVAWFRLPIADDRRTWSASTWREVMRGKALPGSAPVVRFTKTPSGTDDISVRNVSSLDMKMPKEVSIKTERCESADAIFPYDLMREPGALHFVSKDDGLLRSGEQRLIGWIRCPEGKLGNRAIH